MIMKQQNNFCLCKVRLYQAERLLFTLPELVEIKAGDCLTIMGASGVGKSSLLNWLIGHLPNPLRGEGDFTVQGESRTKFPPHLRKFGLIFQNDYLFPHLNVAENLAIGIPSEIDKAQRHRLVNDALISADLEGYGERDSATLSGGQRARIAVMRTLLSKPDVLLMDEAFSGLDQALRQQFRHFVFEHGRKLGLPMLLVTHDLEDAKAAGGKIIRLS